MNATPKTTKELVERLIQLEQENEKLKKANTLLREKVEQLKGIAVSLITRSTKANSFTARQVKDYGEQMLVVANGEKRPKDMRRDSQMKTAQRPSARR